jgi:transmembrane sensor
MTQIDPRILDEAAGWHASLSGETPDFDSFMHWLEASEIHRQAYDQLVLLDGVIDAHRKSLQTQLPANDDQKPKGGNWRWLTAITAAFLIALLSVPLFKSGDGTIATTGIGESRQIALNDGTTITLDAQSAIRARANDERSAELIRGRAHFEVQHDPDKPFTLKVGEFKVQDLGTRFEVRKTQNGFIVSVADGLVSVGGNSFEMRAGKGERISVEDGIAQKSLVDSASIASWKDGRLVYEDAPLSQVVADINRYSKKKLTFDPTLAGQRFSGVLIIEDGSALGRNIADLVGLSLEENEKGQHLLRR